MPDLPSNQSTVFTAGDNITIVFTETEGGYWDIEITGSAGGGSVAIQEEGVEVVAEASALNFDGDDFDIVDGGAGVATIDIAATHAGSTHSAATDTHIADTTDVHDHGSLAGLADDDHSQYRLESADHTHQSTGLQAGQLDHGLALTGLTDDDHTQYLKESVLSEANAVDLTDGGETALHSHAGSGSTIDVQEEGVLELAASALNFDGDDFDVVDAGGGVAAIDVAATHAGSAHHTQSHDHSAAGDGQTLTPATLNVPNAAAPAPTAEGQMAWDNDGNFLVVGDGAATKNIYPVVDATSDPVAGATTSADGTEETTARKDHRHAYGNIAAVDFLVGTATGELSGEIVAGTAPGGELGGTWGSPTVDATHSGSTHSAATDTHIADATDAHDASAISIADAGGDFTATDVEGALDELQADNEAHVAAADPHTGYRLESADHTHQSAGAQAGQLDHGLALTGLTDDDHTQYRLESADHSHVSTGLQGGQLDHGAALTGLTDDDHTIYRLESADHTHQSTGAQAGTLDHGLALTGLTDDDHTQYLKESDVDAVEFFVSAFFDGNGSTLSTGQRPLWRAPFGATVTAVRAYADTGTTTVVNAGILGTGAFCSTNITIDPADAWENGTVNQNQTLTADTSTVYVEIVTAGTATQVTVQIEMTRDLSP